ncbi:MAG TPA: response regulator FixJ [Stellaceae bacterium]|jgi:two-component system response regulator FixJ
MRREQSVYIVDDDEAVRDSLAILLESKGYTVKSFGSALDFLAAVSSLAAGCLIVDIRMPGMDGLELQQRLIERSSGLPLIVITGHGDVSLAVQAMKAGAIDFIEKPFAADAILVSLDAAFARLATPPAERDPTVVAAASKLGLLSPREREVLDGLLAGLPNKSIAYDLGISPRTVEIHRARVMDKMGARSLSELVRLALDAGVRPRSQG